MTKVAIAFFLIGATVLWGGLAVSLTMLIKSEKKASLEETKNNK